MFGSRFQCFSNTRWCLEIHVGDTHADFEVFVAVFGNLSIPLYGVGSHAIVDRIEIVSTTADSTGVMVS